MRGSARGAYVAAAGFAEAAWQEALGPDGGKSRKRARPAVGGKTIYGGP